MYDKDRADSNYRLGLTLQSTPIVSYNTYIRAYIHTYIHTCIYVHIWLGAIAPRRLTAYVHSIRSTAPILICPTYILDPFFLHPMFCCVACFAFVFGASKPGEVAPDRNHAIHPSPTHPITCSDKTTPCTIQPI